MNDLDSELEALAIRSESIADAELAQRWWEAKAAIIRKRYETHNFTRSGRTKLDNGIDGGTRRDHADA